MPADSEANAMASPDEMPHMINLRILLRPHRLTTVKLFTRSQSLQKLEMKLIMGLSMKKSVLRPRSHTVVPQKMRQETRNLPTVTRVGGLSLSPQPYPNSWI
ncbi:hypothetical protein KC339_g138 [Hortaea werneckii]|nr:hypothetical protein KC339_g138 [Hortaea werneckii]